MLPTLNINEINLYVLENTNEIDLQLQAHCFKQLSWDEQQKQQSFHFKQDQNLYLMAHAMLRMILSDYLGCSTLDLVFVVNRYGKPALKDFPDIRFNLSHSKNRVVLAVTCNPHIDIGIDIEYGLERDNLADLAAHYFSAKEASQVLQLPLQQQNDLFFQLWTLKESYIKAIGKGLSIDLDSFSFTTTKPNIKVKHHSNEAGLYDWWFFWTNQFNGYHLSMAIRNSNKNNAQPGINSYAYLPTQFCHEISLNFVTSSTI